jgi:sporulation protein YlmC with PRC-barrel domain
MVEQTTMNTAALEGKPVYSSDGVSVGEVTGVFLDNDTERPEWIALQQGAKQVLVPVAEASVRADGISVPYSGAQIESAPAAGGEAVSQETERALASHYGIAYSEKRSATGLPESRPKQQQARPTREASAGGRRADERTRDELYAEARRLGIEGRSKMNKGELARAVDRQAGGRGGAADKANPIEVQKFLEGVDYPTRKADLVREAERQGADASVRSTLERIRDEKFDSPADVSEAIGRLS